VTTPAPHSPPTPERFFNAVNAHQLTEAIKTAIELDVFTAIGEGNTTAAAIAKRCEASERGVRTLCDFLTIHDFLSKEGTTYALAPDSALFLTRNSPAFVGAAIHFLLNPRLREGHFRLTEAVRRGGTALTDGPIERQIPDWVAFARSMMGISLIPARNAAAELHKTGETNKVLDVAAGHGLYGISIAKQNPSAHIYATDWREVLEVAHQNAQDMGVADRHHLLPGDAFEVDFGGGYDLVMVPNFLHHFGRSTCVNFMRKVHDALKPEGRAAVVEFIPNPDRVTPPTAAAFSLLMLAYTASGDAYTFAEIADISKEAGFARAELSQADVGRHTLVVAHR
jgi:2-polyprenyl-3-methyl-5-hydroxy-6-metoxy-1,4-benzoquinol methylase